MHASSIFFNSWVPVVLTAEFMAADHVVLTAGSRAVDRVVPEFLGLPHRNKTH